MLRALISFGGSGADPRDWCRDGRKTLSEPSSEDEVKTLALSSKVAGAVRTRGSETTPVLSQTNQIKQKQTQKQKHHMNTYHIIIATTEV